MPIFQCHVFWSYFQAPVTVINFARVASIMLHVVR